MSLNTLNVGNILSEIHKLHFHVMPQTLFYKYEFRFHLLGINVDRLCGLVVSGYRSGGPGSILGTTRKKKVVGLERGPLSLASTTKELLDRKVAAPV
jgi:hypothetical protein